ncbi:MAG: hypothetical protein IT463_00230 [Planctomycetes bacterium]|nr:hypothetical protein [Planctomycetota bacterium]
MANLAASLDTLWRVQQLDAALRDNKQAMDRARADTTRAGAAQTKAATSATEAETALHRLRTEHKELEQELARLDSRIRKLEAEAAQASQAAVQKHRAEVDELEGKGLELLDRISAAEKAVTAARGAAAEAGKARESAGKTAAAKIADLEAEAGRLRGQREALVVGLAPELLAVYESAQTRYPGAALARVADGFCGVCSGELTRQLVSQLKARAELLRCPHCLRLLDMP